MKMAPILGELERRSDEFESLLIDTGQHYDDVMSRIFFEELGISEPKHRLDVGSGTHAQQTARVMERLEPVLVEEEPDVLLVPGDVNSTLAAALVASKLGIRIGHVEAGLRSFDRTMPEEINRLLTDRLADLLFIHSPEAHDHLLSEGAPEEAIHYVGNTMIDTLVLMRPRIDAIRASESHGLPAGGYLLVTLHRPALVDGPLLRDAVQALVRISEELPVVFPAHPRTRGAMDRMGLRADAGDLRMLEPLGYLEFLSLLSDAAAVLTDSGGIQEESTFLGVPVFTLRDNTERPVTVSMGTNTLLGLRPDRIVEVPGLIDDVRRREVKIPPKWDGASARRIVDALAAELPRARSDAPTAVKLRSS